MNYKTLLLVLLVSYISAVCCIKWEDCGIPLSRKLYFQDVVVSPSTINIADIKSDHSISISVTANLQNYKLGKVLVNTHLQVLKDGQLYVDALVGDTCSILGNYNGAVCPLEPDQYTYTYKYSLPPVPTGTYTVRISHKENATGVEIGCLSTTLAVVGLGLDACSYTSELAAVFLGTAQFLEGDKVIQIGPWGPDGIDLGYPWGTFKSITASPDLVGYALKTDNYVWGLRGARTASDENARTATFSGYVVIGHRPDTKDYQNAELVFQGLFVWNMIRNDYATYEFQSGTFEVVPGYPFPEGFPYPLNLGNLGVLTVGQSKDRSSFSIATSKTWCRCNCDIGGVGHDDSLKGSKANQGSSMSSFKKGTIAIAVIGTFLLVVAVIVIVKLRRSKPRPVVYDDADLMDPQKPDYGTMAINDAFEAQDSEFD